ncbi:MAG: single-stranded-DNA-specific exonuclease RecJ, partial [Gammaproteobacteria bacterium]|nr:single-stranded-DNA-specific exonuclease RecJ [Gammaproteobacteria bacterium]
IFSLLETCRDLFIDFGGHAGAAGFEIKEENLGELEQRLKKEIDQQISFDDLMPHVIVDAELAPQQINLGLIKELESLGPYGEGNPAPIFVSRDLNMFDLRLVGKNDQHLKLKLTDQTVNLETIGFGLGNLAEQLKFDTKYDIVYHLESNEWNGFETAQLRLLDIREAKTPIYNNVKRMINS